MNKENVIAAIELMKRAKNLQMESYQSSGRKIETIEELHSCGYTACFAGYLAISGLPGFDAEFDGSPVYQDPDSGDLYGRGDTCVSKFLGISIELARKIVYDNATFYSKPFIEVTPADVIAKLELILAGELE